jgi:hypothetical protein
MSRRQPTFYPTHRTIKEIEQMVRIHKVAQHNNWASITTEGDDTISSKVIKIRLK